MTSGERSGGGHPDDVRGSARSPGRIGYPLARRSTVAVLALLMIGLGVVFFRPGASRELPLYWEAPEFTLVHQGGDVLRSAELRGTPWMASFVFTNCASICPLITQKMAGVRDGLAAEGVLGDQVRLVSFTVDPARDTPEVLREYAGRFGGSPPEEWAFLTGEPPEAVRTMIQEGFKLTASVSPEHEHRGGDYQVMHSPRLVLVDASGRVRGLYDTREPDAIERLRADLRALLE